ncbi:MAG TPA: hypothetical protein VKV18_10310 [Chthonomonas sp.]|uniref:hypothetical protein n=1 Tax=Chthonomonas sp. TaxID=2282153 RepID=UPI002B4AFA01|nr:hypothetical protein [Chthonomonas sp.]HLI49068.1 hypothetical protein [Chthonomonas sp.]
MRVDSIHHLSVRKRIVGWLAFWLLLVLQRSCTAAPRIVLLIVPDLTCADLKTLPLRPAMQAFSSQGVCGWMVCRAASNVPRNLLNAKGADRLASLLLSLGTGCRAVAPPNGILAEYPPTSMNRFEGSALNVALLRQCYEVNRRIGYPIDIGLLGAFVHLYGGATAAFADADNNVRANEALLVAMDADGFVDLAGPRLFCARANLLAPEGAEADVDRMLRAFNQLPPNTRLTVISFFDLQRATEEATSCLPSMVATYRREALGRLGRLMLGVIEWVRSRPDAIFWCCAPGPSSNATTGERLAPVLLMGQGVPHGTIFPPSTRWDGLGVNTDLLPTIARQLGLHRIPRSVVGRAWEFKAGRSFSYKSFCDYFRSLVMQAELQNLYGGLPTLQLLCILGGVVCWKRQKLSPSVFGLIIGLLPLLLLVLPALFAFNEITAGIALGISLMGLAALGEWMWRTQRDAVSVFRTMAGVFVVCVVGDLLTGSHLIRRAWMSYSMMEGARFFGIGNEYMGALFGAALVMLPWLIGEKGKWLKAVVVYAVILFVVAWPQWGAKVGAIPTGIGAFGLALFASIKDRVGWKEIAWLGVLALLLFEGLALIDLHFHGANESHLARALKGEGGGSFAVVVLRKLRMEGFLLFHSPWAAVLLGNLMATGYLHRLQKAQQGVVERAMWLGFYGGVVCSLLFNDAGVPAAALLAQQGLGLVLCEGGRRTERLSGGIS